MHTFLGQRRACCICYLVFQSEQTLKKFNYTYVNMKVFDERNYSIINLKKVDVRAWEEGKARPEFASNAAPAM